MYPQLTYQQTLPDSVADNMIENCVGTFQLPLGLGLNFVINGKDVTIPMCVEEPSVIAAVSGSAKTIALGGGFTAESCGNVMISQIQLLDVEDVEESATRILQNKTKLKEYANTFCAKMVKRGGGVVDIKTRIVMWDKEKYMKIHEKDEFLSNHDRIDRTTSCSMLDNSSFVLEGNKGVLKKHVDQDTKGKDKMLIIHILVDVCESMGANLVTTVAEGLAPKILELCKGGRYVLRIVSNLNEERRAKASFLIPVSKLKYKDVEGLKVAKGIIEAYAMANEDKYRASTHNKGIMNGVDAVALALGQDWRAIEAGAHAWACRSGNYRTLTEYKLVKDKSGKIFLYGSCEFPVAVGVRGGAVQTHPIMAFTHGICGSPTSRELGEMLVCVGLAQNFAAIRALVTEGIQRGHMGLHSRNIAIGAGAPPHLVSEVSNYMVSRGRIDIETATDYLNAHSILASSTQNRFKSYKQSSPSTLFVDLELYGLKINLNIVFETLGGKEPIHLALCEESPTSSPENNTNDDSNKIQTLLFENKTPQWFKLTFEALMKIRVSGKTPQRNNLLVQTKLKLLSMLQNIILYRLLQINPEETSRFVSKILAAELNPLSRVNKLDSQALMVGFPLLLALWQGFKYQVDASVNSNSLSNAMREEQLRIFSAAIRTKEAMASETSFDNFMSVHVKRWQVTMFLLCDIHSLPSDLVTQERLFFIFKLGSFFEWEGTIAHDIAKWKRDLEKSLPNTYLFWLKSKNQKPSNDLLKAFIRDVEERMEKKKSKLMEVKEPNEFFDSTVFLQAIPVVRGYYGVSKELAPIQSKL